jgi:hypothetical protein
MRAVVLLLVILLSPPLRTVQGQERTSPLVPASLAHALPAQGALATPVDALDSFALPEARNRGKGALYGLGIGALVGGVGLAALQYALNESIPRDGYTVATFILGATVGGAAGAVLGAIIGVPERDESRSEQARLLLSPRLSRGGRVALSVSFPSR